MFVAVPKSCGQTFQPYEILIAFQPPLPYPQDHPGTYPKATPKAIPRANLEILFCRRNYSSSKLRAPGTIAERVYAQ